MNKCILVGRLTRDPELKNTQSGVPLANFTVAVDRRYKNQQGEREADFISCVAWRSTAEFVSKYFRKGDPIAVVGSVQTRSWEDDTGNKRYATEINVDEASFVPGKPKASQSASNQDTEWLDEHTESSTDVTEYTGDLPFEL